MGSRALPTDDMSRAMWAQLWSLAVRADVARLFYSSDHGTKIKLDMGVHHQHAHFAVTSQQHPDSSSHPEPKVSGGAGTRGQLPGSIGQVRAGGHVTLSL